MRFWIGLINFFFLIGLVALANLTGLSWKEYLLVGIGLLPMFFGDVGKSRKFLLTLIVLLIIASCLIPFKNIIANHSFENRSLTPWIWKPQIYQLTQNSYALSNVQCSIDPEKGPHGRNALLIENNQEPGDQRYGYLFQQIDVWPNAVYTASFYVKGKIGNKSLWFGLSDDWAEYKSTHHVQPGDYKKWKKEQVATLVTDDSRYAFAKFVSEAPGHFWIDDVNLKLNILETVKRWLGFKNEA
ncbi:MAG: hypothetical protein COV74_04985 [Candidatus Omnitrophica bacterium CG11_big_fil_rev_8_21_14_0_20_45_26]|uniref:CBM-cenC domain-containing protein n=1 Tax=Candidatus Abzuiibacterium crystallinum TaxID=1974748 RepID=A0A2H0LPW5_9BACT|nr:MAG: hypothetical protein COV74_04985 [Candidatus Omnitrophica bacterium CG11_big_fil_rev_8_21_14_0_20_45_26]PIW63616.1 MAG: hypothetical protein COW12_09900 [Candidatus Omnitrophica bacterium CG12_big_fil_rev_8_21_14_0_65_45_16]